jgi:hypothetical protein
MIPICPALDRTTYEYVHTKLEGFAFLILNKPLSNDEAFLLIMAVERSAPSGKISN